MGTRTPQALPEMGDPTITNGVSPRDAWKGYGMLGCQRVLGWSGEMVDVGYDRVMGDLWWDGRLGETEGSGKRIGDLGDGGIWSNEQIGLGWDIEGRWTILGQEKWARGDWGH